MGNMTTLQILQGVHDWVIDKIGEETANFITETVNDLLYYYTKSETYTKAEVQQIVDAIKQFTYEVVQVIPTASASTMNKIYLVPAPKSEDKNVKEEYITIQDGSTYSWEMLGTTSIDLSNYYTKGQTDSAISSALSNALASYTTTADLTTLLAQKQDVIQDLSDIRAGASAGSTAVQPSTLNNTVKDVVAESGVYDVSANNDNTKFESLSALLSSANLNTLIPTDIRKGGMSIKFIQSSDNKYVQFRFMLSGSFTSAQFTNPANWQGEDTEPTAGSENFVKSGGINKSILDGWKLSTDITTSVFDQNHKYWNLLGDLKANVNYIIAITANSRVVSDVALRYTEPLSTSAGEMIKANAVLNGTQYFKVTPSQDAKYLYLASVDNVGDDISSVVVYQQTNAAEILTKVGQKATFSTGEKVNDVSIGNNLPDYTNKIVKEKFVISEALKNITIPNSNVSATVYNQNHRFWDFGSTLVKGNTYIIVISANTSVVSDVYLRYTERTSTSAGQLIKSSCPLEGTLYFKVTPLEDAKYLNLPSVDNLGNDISSVVVYNIFPMEIDSIPTSGSIKTVLSGGVYLNDEKSFGATGLPIYKLGGYAGSYFNAANNKRLTIDKIKYGIEYTLASGYTLSAAVIFKDDGTFVKQGATESELINLADDCYAAISVRHNASYPTGENSECSVDENPFSSICFGDNLRIRHIFGYKTNSVGDYYQKMWSTAKCIPYMYQKVNNYGSYNYNLVLAINTDTHAYTSDVLSRINRWPIQCFKDSNLLDAFLSLGDMFWANQNKTKVQRYEEAEKIWNTIDTIGASQRPQLVCIGNHDNNQDGGQANTEYFTQEDKYNCFIKPMLERFSSNHTSLDTESKYTGWRKLPIVTDNVDYPTYYSIEFAAKKTKLIVLDCYDFSDEYLLGNDYVINSTYYSERELDFLVSQLSSTPDDYKVIIGTHHIYDSGSIIALGNSANVLKTILAAFVNKTSASATLRDELDSADIKTYNVSFGESSGDLLWLVGHVHIFEEKKLSVNSVGSTPIHCFSCISADQEGKLQRGYMIDGFDIFNYDYVNHYFIFTRYGDKGTLYGTNPNNNDDGDSNGFHFAEVILPNEEKSANRGYVLNSLLPYSTILNPIDIKTLLSNGASGYYRVDGTLNAGGGGGSWTYYPAVTMKAGQCIVIKYNTFAQSAAYDTVANLAIKDSNGSLLQSFTPKYAYDNNFEIVYKAETDVTLYFSIYNSIGYNGYIYNTTPESIDYDYEYLFELFSAISNEAIESEGHSKNYRYEIFNAILVAGTKYILAINTNATITTDIYLRYTEASSVADGELIAQGIILVAGKTTYITVTPQEDTHYLYISSASSDTNQVNFAIAYNTNSVSNDTPFIGDYIYTTFNDIGIAANTAGYAQRNMAAMLQIERLFKFNINNIPNVRFSEDREKVAIYAPFSDFNGTMNSNTTISGTTKVNKNTFSHNIDIKNCTKKVAFTQRSTCASNGLTSKIKLLCIGDSITNLSGADYGRVSNGASVYWSWINQMFGMDYIENNTDNELLNVGAQSSLEFGYTHKGVTKNVKGFAEGRSGWSTVDYISREWRNNEVDNYSGYNFFYNPNEAGDVKFSLDYYLTHYRTMDDSGNRLALADCGDRVKSSSEYNSLSAADKKKFRNYSDNCNVCTPTHIIIQLGTNDSNIDTAVANLEAIIRKIRTEGYTMPIAIAFPGQGGCYYPKLYQDYSADKILFEQAAVNKAQAVVTAYNELANELNTELGDVYFISIYSVQPCPHFETREINSPNVLVSGEKYSLCWGNQPKLHPDIFAHVNWAYQYYSWIKWTL